MARKLAWLFGVALVVLGVDQASKYLVLRDLTHRFDGRPSFDSRLAAMYSTAPYGWDGMRFHPKSSAELVPRYLRLRYAENTGAAWGMFRSWPENIRGPLFNLISLAAVVLISYAFLRLKGLPTERWALWGLPLVLGGALGNYVDRLSRGFVVDFIEAHWHDQMAWPSFNVADSAICIGVGMLLIDAMVRKERKGSDVVAHPPSGV